MDIVWIIVSISGSSIALIVALMVSRTSFRSSETFRDIADAIKVLTDVERERNRISNEERYQINSGGLLRRGKEIHISNSSADRLGKTIGNRIGEQLGRLTLSSGSTYNIVTRSAHVSTAPDQKMIREISHSLNTPLNQIELAITRTLAHMTDVMDHAVAGSLRSATNSIALCRAVLSAYRDLAALEESAGNWDIDDLRISLMQALSVFDSQYRDDVDNITYKVDSPPKVVGYSNYYLVAALLPLLQNAVEAVDVSGRVSCSITEVENEVVVNVSNEVSVRPEIEKMTVAGYSTKGHEGTGLSSVRTLIERVGRGPSFVFDSGLMNVQVRFPRNSEEV